MNTTQAIIILKNGARKYGFILDHSDESRIQFIPGTDAAPGSAESHELIEHIPLEHIVSIDTYLK